jgi:hypothetical protein
MKVLFSTVVIVSALTSVINPALGQGLAFATNTFAVGNGPSSVIAVDINNDGKVDLICTDSKDNALTVLTNDGSGGFGSNATINVPPSNPTCVTAADINGNGKLDLICAINSGYLFALTNDGSGGFVSNAVYGLAIQDSPSCVVVADVNGDGKPDLITANYPGSTLTVLTNDSSGGFVLSTTLTVGSRSPAPWTHWVAAADINGDGRVDLVSANSTGPGSVTIFTNNGAGGFGTNATYSVLGQPYCVAAADLNGDGKMDLITADNILPLLTVLTNNGGGSFGTETNYGVGPWPFFVAVADINGDGKPDLICANSGTNTLTVLTNDGSGGFDLCATLTVGNDPRSIAVADVNGDGKLDLVSANYDDNTLTVLTQVTPPPELTTTSVSPDTVVVSWPLLATNFVLQTNSDLTTTNWGTPGYTISTNGQLESVTLNPLPLENLFFRLIAQ